MGLYQLGLQDSMLEKPRTRESLKIVIGSEIPITSYYQEYLRGFHFQKPVICPFCKAVQGISGVDKIPFECPECEAT
jgi:hypothetical protein